MKRRNLRKNAIIAAALCCAVVIGWRGRYAYRHYSCPKCGVSKQCERKWGWTTTRIHGNEMSKWLSTYRPGPCEHMWVATAGGTSGFDWDGSSMGLETLNRIYRLSQIADEVEAKEFLDRYFAVLAMAETHEQAEEGRKLFEEVAVSIDESYGERYPGQPELQAAEARGESDLTRECLAKFQALPKDLQSYRYTAEIETTDTIEARKRRVEDLERLPDVFPPILETARAELQRPDRTFFDVNMVCHSNGCRRIDVEDGFYTTEGQKRVTVEKISTWNGTTYLNFHHALGSSDPPVAMLKDAPSPMSFEGYDYPWKLSGRFAEEMTQAMDEGIPVRIDPDKSQDRYSVEFTVKERTYHGTLMCRQGTRTQIWEVQKDGTTVERATAVFKELDEGVWFVRRGKRELYFPDGQNDFTTVVKIDNVKINDPNITERTFRFSLPEGTRGYDVSTKTSFVVGESSRIEVLDD